MSEAFRNPVPVWLKSGALVTHEGKRLRLGTCLEAEDLDESDVAAAVLFHRWRTPQGFRDAVMEERRKRLEETAERRTFLQTVDAADAKALRAFAADAADGGHLAEVTLAIRDHTGGMRTCTMTLDDLLERIREYRQVAREAKP